jgi:hypothetical protein
MLDRAETVDRWVELNEAEVERQGSLSLLPCLVHPVPRTSSGVKGLLHRTWI